MTQSPLISVVIPCYNEQDNLVPLVKTLTEVIAPLNVTYEIVITDDCSKDNSWEILKKLAAEDPHVVAQRFENNAGQSAALWAGIKAARGQYIATLDAAKRAEGDNFIRQISSKIANGVRNWITHETVSDSGCCYRMFKRECAADLKFFKGMHRFLPTLFKIEGFTVAEIPVNHQHRLAGVSKYGVWNRVFASSYDLFAVRWMQKRMFRFKVGEKVNFGPDGK